MAMVESVLKKLSYLIQHLKHREKDTISTQEQASVGDV